jgi:hypothetical protein
MLLLLLLLLLLQVLLCGSTCNRNCDASLQDRGRVPAEMKYDNDNSDQGACDVVGHSLRKPLFYFSWATMFLLFIFRIFSFFFRPKFVGNLLCRTRMQVIR